MLQAVDDHKDCRLEEFARWPRMLLERERQHLSRVMAEASAFIDYTEQNLIVHDLSDIDWVLARIDEPPPVKV